MSWKLTVRTLALAGLGLACSSGGSEEEKTLPPTQLQVRLLTDLSPGVDLSQILIESLSETGERIPGLHAFRLETCAPAEGGQYFLGSFGVAMGESDSVRLRVRGVGPGVGGPATDVIMQEVSARFQPGVNKLDILLSHSCLKHASCPGGQTCAPATGQCEPIRVETKLTALSQSELEQEGCLSVIDLPDLCTDADGLCLTGCEHADDSDCPKLLGEPCAAAADCASGSCQQEVCCDAACDGVCSRCDLTDHRGTCTALDFSMADDADNCGACGSICDGTHLAARSCTDGQCDGACTENYADCNSDKRTDGCETNLLEPTHCGACDNACAYGFCDAVAKECKWDWRGSSDTSARFSLTPDVMRSGSISIGARGVVQALGVLVPSEFAGTSVRLAIYREDRFNEAPAELVVQTAPLLVQDSSTSLMPAVSGGLRVEGPVAPTVLQAPDLFWILLQVSEPMDVFAAPDTMAAWGSTPEWSFRDFPLTAPAIAVDYIDQLSAYAIVTP